MCVSNTGIYDGTHFDRICTNETSAEDIEL